MQTIIRKLIAVSVLLICAFTHMSILAKDDQITDFSLKNKTLGFEEKPVVNIELILNKTRDLHVAVQNMDTKQTIKRTMKRIKKSGKYHFTLDVDGLEPGKYRVNAYITPKGDNWNDRIGETHFKIITIVDAPKAPVKVKKSVYAKKDLIKKVTWPKHITDDSETILTAKYEISMDRDLHIKLFNSESWEEFGALKYTVKKSGEVSVPFSDLLTNFSSGKYAWVVYLTEIGAEKEITKKQGKHFVIGSK